MSYLYEFKNISIDSQTKSGENKAKRLSFLTFFLLYLFISFVEMNQKDISHIINVILF